MGHTQSVSQGRGWYQDAVEYTRQRMAGKPTRVMHPLHSLTPLASTHHGKELKSPLDTWLCDS